jgi:hypothetical protein
MDVSFAAKIVNNCERWNNYLSILYAAIHLIHCVQNLSFDIHVLFK